MYNNFTDFSFDEISEWISDYWNFIIKPRFVINKILQKNKEKIFRQFIFHFLVYTASFLFLSFGTTITDWIKPAVINLFFAIPLISILFLSTKLATGKNYLKEIIIFILGSLLIFLPLTIILYTAFLQSENYTYKFSLDIISGIIALYIAFMLGFAVENDIKKSIKISFVNYLLLNLIYFVFVRIDNDPYSVKNFDTYDPVYEEYTELVKPLKTKESIPTIRFVSAIDGKIDTHFGTQDIIKEDVSSSNNSLEKKYLETLEFDIKHIIGSSKTLQFKRNKIIAGYWLKYYNDIKEEAKYKIMDEEEIQKLQLRRLPIKILDELGGKMYIMRTDVGKIFSTQTILKAYNNSMVSNHETCESINQISQITLFFFGKIAEYIVGDLILHEGDPKPYKEVFLEIE